MPRLAPKTLVPMAAFAATTMAASLSQAETPILPLDADRCAIARALVAAPVAGCAEPMSENVIWRSLQDTPEGGSTGGYTVQFDFDSGEITNDAQAHLTRLGSVLTSDLSSLCILLVGHADTSGAAAYNMKLSERRASAVRLFLAGPGQVATSRLSVKGEGESSPLPGVLGTDPSNRRVEILAKRATDGMCL